MTRVALALLTLTASSGCANDVIAFHDGERLVLEVPLIGRAVTAAERRRGLAGTTLDSGEGLLLEFPSEDDVCIANGDIDQSLDVVFITEGGTIGAIERDVPARDPTPRCATARWVLEVLAPTAAPLAPTQTATGL